MTGDGDRGADQPAAGAPQSSTAAFRQQQATVDAGVGGRDLMRAVAQGKKALAWPIERFAELVVALAAAPAARDETWSRWGITTATARDYVWRAWVKRLNDDATLRAAFERCAGRPWNAAGPHGDAAAPQSGDFRQQLHSEQAVPARSESAAIATSGNFREQLRGPAVATPAQGQDQTIMVNQARQPRTPSSQQGSFARQFQGPQAPVVAPPQGQDQTMMVKRGQAHAAPTPAAAQPLPAQPLPAQPLPAQPLPAQPLPAQPLPAQALPAQALPAQALPAQALPAQALPAQPLPAQAPSAEERFRVATSWPLEHWALLCAQLKRQPDQAPQIWTAWGFEESELQGRIAQAWTQHLDTDRTRKRQFDRLLKRQVAALRRAERG